MWLSLSLFTALVVARVSSDAPGTVSNCNGCINYNAQAIHVIQHVNVIQTSDGQHKKIEAFEQKSADDEYQQISESTYRTRLNGTEVSCQKI